MFCSLLEAAILSFLSLWVSEDWCFALLPLFDFDFLVVFLAFPASCAAGGLAVVSESLLL